MDPEKESSNQVHVGISDIENFDLLEKEEGENNENSRTYSYKQPLLTRRITNTTSQIAIVGSNVCPIESLDYEIFENDIFKQDWRSANKSQILKYVVLKWALALVIGLATGLVGFFNNIAVENIAGYKLLLTSSFMAKEEYYKAFAVYASMNVGLATAAAALCAFIAPAAAGSGIPEVKAYLNGIDAYSIPAPSTLFVKIFGSILGVSAGFVVGKEGPMVHTGACIASLLGQGAGVATAFRAPVGGVLFAFEEAASWWRSALWRTFFTTAVVAIVLRGFVQYCATGNCGLFGQGGLIMYDVSAADATYSVPDILAVLLLGVIGGIFGSIYNYLVDKVIRTYSIIHEKGTAPKILLVITIALLMSSVSYGLPWFAMCIACPTDVTVSCPTVGKAGTYISFNCPTGYYNDIASLFLNTNDDAIRNLFSTDTTKEFHIYSLFIFFAAVFILGIITYGIAIPSGLFIPVILARACYGRLVGRLFESISSLVTGLFALLGAASLLGGTMRMTVSLCIILLELTNDLLLLPLVFSKERVVHKEKILHRFGPFDFAKAGSGKGLKVEDLDIEEEEMEMYVDLHPITNASPYTVVETMSLAKAAILFRQLGLRHLCLVPKSQGRSPIVGILTRHDFMPEHILGLDPNIKPHNN
ncbi:hypothetical protein ACLB2K_006692 [Fragaria x ananassa]